MLQDTDRAEWGLRLLAAIRIVMGFMLLWAFADKLFGLGMLTTPEAAIINGGSPTEYYLTELVSGVFTGFFNAMAGNPAVDLLLMAGLLLVGIGLVMGIASKLSCIGMCVMMALMYMLSVPPVDNPLVDYHIVYILAVLAVYMLGGFGKWSLEEAWVSLGPVRRFNFLQ